MELQRPTFWEGQILAGADLNSAVESATGRDARHDRYLHDWGIAVGLTMQKVGRTDPNGDPYVEVTVEPGMAVDGTGREVIVPEPERLSEARFFEINGARPDPEAYYPVLLHGLDRPAAPPASANGACGPASAPTRIVEGFEITFGGLGGEDLLDEQEVPDVTAGPVPAAGQPPWEVLLGFVRWRPITGGGRFTDAVGEANGAGRRYAGVKADTVAARGGSLQLRPHPTVQAGQPALQLGGTPVGLTFGLLKGDGQLDPRFSVDADGNVTAAGTISGKLKPGEVRVQSGVATDGVVLPLPAGVTEDAVRDGEVTLHVQLTPHIPVPQPAAGGFELYRQLECELDTDRRVRCRAAWFDLGNLAAGPTERPAGADYLLVATVRSAP